jgi:hypothetical protein
VRGPLIEAPERRQRLFRGEEFDPGKICDGLEAIVGSDQDAIGGARREIEREGIGVGYLAVDFDLGGMNGSVAVDGYDLDFNGEEIAQDMRLMRSAQALAQVSGNFAPLDR